MENDDIFMAYYTGLLMLRAKLDEFPKVYDASYLCKPGTNSCGIFAIQSTSLQSLHFKLSLRPLGFSPLGNPALGV